MVITRSSNTDRTNIVSESDTPAMDTEMAQGGTMDLPQAMDAGLPDQGVTSHQGIAPEVPNPPQNPPWNEKVSQDISKLFEEIRGIKEDFSHFKIETVATNMNFENLGQSQLACDELKRLKYENAQMRAEINELKRKCVRLESQSRRENLLFDGVEESEKETWSDTEKKLQGILAKLDIPNHLDIKLERVHRQGEKKIGKPRTIIAKFSHFKDRETVWQKRFSLKNTKTWISEDFPTEIAQARQQLYPSLREGLRLTKIPDSGIKSVSLRLDKLYVNNRQFGVNDIDKLPLCLQPQKMATKTDSVTNVVAFYTKNSIFSNFNSKFPFKLEGETYNCPEQYFHRSKAIHFNDHETASKIMSTLDPLKQLQLGKTVKNYDHKSWMQKARQVLKNANVAKYAQNGEAKKELLATGNATLAESSPNKFWGTGFKLHEKDSTNPTAWTDKNGQNVMGKILMEIRESLM